MDPTIWNLLHDGTVIAAERSGADVRLTIEVEYVRRRLTPPADTFVLVLLGCSRLAYTPYDEAEIEDLATLVQREPDLVEAVVEGDTLVVWGGSGVLRVRYEGLSILLDEDTPTDLDAVREAARSYWEEWAREK